MTQTQKEPNNAMWKKIKRTQTIKKQHSERENRIRMMEGERETWNQTACAHFSTATHISSDRKFWGVFAPSLSFFVSINLLFLLSGCFFFTEIIRRKNWRFVCQAVLIFIAIKSSFYGVRNTSTCTRFCLLRVCVCVFCLHNYLSYKMY